MPKGAAEQLKLPNYQSEYLELFADRGPGRPKGAKRNGKLDERLPHDRRRYNLAKQRALALLMHYFPDDFEEHLINEYRYLVNEDLRRDHVRSLRESHRRNLEEMED